MVLYYAPPNFPFAKLYPLGILMIILGVISLSLGGVDLVYTQMKYTTCDNTNILTWQCPLKPCKSPSVVWALVAPGLWTGFFIIIGGSVATSLMYASGHTIKTKRDSSGVLAGLIAFPLGPATLVVSALRLYYMNSYFYCVSSPNNRFVITDYIEFLMPILVAFSVFLAWCLALAVLVALCRRGQLSMRDEFEYEYGRRYRDPRDEIQDSPRSRRRPYMLPDPYDYKYYPEGPRQMPWRDRSQMGWREPVHYPGRAYATAPRSDPYPTYSRRYMPRPGYERGYYTTKTYNRY